MVVGNGDVLGREGKQSYLYDGEGLQCLFVS